MWDCWIPIIVGIWALRLGWGTSGLGRGEGDGAPGCCLCQGVCSKKVRRKGVQPKFVPQELVLTLSHTTLCLFLIQGAVPGRCREGAAAVQAVPRRQPLAVPPVPR